MLLKSYTFGLFRCLCFLLLTLPTPGTTPNICPYVARYNSTHLPLVQPVHPDTNFTSAPSIYSGATPKHLPLIQPATSPSIYPIISMYCSTKNICPSTARHWFKTLPLVQAGATLLVTCSIVQSCSSKTIPNTAGYNTIHLPRYRSKSKNLP